MTGKKEINPFLKQVLELGPPLAFFFIYLRLRDDSFMIGGTEYSGFIVATILFVPLMLAAMGVLWFLTGKLSRMQIFTAFMVLFFGGLTAWFNDERFFKMKTTLVYGFFALILGIGLLGEKSTWHIGFGNKGHIAPEYFKGMVIAQCSEKPCLCPKNFYVLDIGPLALSQEFVGLGHLEHNTLVHDIHKSVIGIPGIFMQFGDPGI